MKIAAKNQRPRDAASHGGAFDLARALGFEIASIEPKTFSGRALTGGIPPKNSSRKEHVSDESCIRLPGRVLLPSGEERDCAIVCDEAGGMRIAPAVAERGDRLICHARGLGVIEGIAGHPAGDRQELELRGTDTHLARLAARIDWHRRRAGGHDELRSHDRIVPTVAKVVVRNADGLEMIGTLLDVSATGAALRLDERPDVGSPLVIGRRHAKVVRRTSDGVAVSFNLPLRAEDVSPEITL